MNTEKIDLAQILQDIANLVIKSSYIIKEISQKMTQIYYKDQFLDPVTEADYLVQYTIEQYLNNKYPGIKIVGEQNLVTDEIFCRQMLKTAQNLSSFQIDSQKIIKGYPFEKKKHFINKQSICLWIDPLDCTRGFVSNRKQQVTILVGISQNNVPIAGVIGQPFKINKINQCEFDPKVFIGSVYFNKINQKKYCYEYNHNRKKWKKWQQFESTFDKEIEKKVAISNRRLPERQCALMKKMNLERVPTGGAGNKIVMMIKKQVGNMMFVDSKTSKWDSCAGEAIIKSMGGYSIKPNLQDICYCPQSEVGNYEGFIICLSLNVFQQMKNHIAQEQFQNFKKIMQNTVDMYVI